MPRVVLDLMMALGSCSCLVMCVDSLYSRHDCGCIRAQRDVASGQALAWIGSLHVGCGTLMGRSMSRVDRDLMMAPVTCSCLDMRVDSPRSRCSFSPPLEANFWKPFLVRGMLLSSHFFLVSFFVLFVSESMLVDCSLRFTHLNAYARS